MDELREGVGLQAYGQKDPLVVYKTEGYEYFQQLLANIQHDVVHTIYRVQPVVAQQPVRTKVTDESEKSAGRRGRRQRRQAAQVAQGRGERAVSVRQRQEVQALPRGAGGPDVGLIPPFSGSLLLTQNPMGRTPIRFPAPF